jgi:hypothetical protein
MNTCAATTRVGELILVRLLATAKTPPSLSRLRDDLGRFFKQPPGDEQWRGEIDDLVGAGLLTARPYRLTDAGRQKALEFLGLDTLPPRTDWKALRTRYLVPKALGLSATAGEAHKRIANEEGLAAYLLKAHYDLPVEAGATLARVLEALVCKELGFSAETTFDGVRAAVLGRLLGSTDRLRRDQIRQQLPRHVLGARKAGVEGLREAVLQRWVEGANGRAAAPAENGTAIPDAEFNAPVFADTVRAAARNCPTGRFGDNKVFINHVWRQLGQDPCFPALDLAAFKDRLVKAHHAGLLALSRADLVQVMDPADVQESEARYLNAVFHFILLENSHP